MKKMSRVWSVVLTVAMVCSVFTFMPAAAYGAEDNAPPVIDPGDPPDDGDGAPLEALGGGEPYEPSPFGVFGEPGEVVEPFAADPVTVVYLYVDGVRKDLTATYPYLVNGERSLTGTLGAGGCTAYFDAATGILNLHGYNHGRIGVGNSNPGDLTIKLTGDNTISASSDTTATGIAANRDNNITITADSAATLTLNVSQTGMWQAIGIGFSDDTYNGDVVIGGQANVTINLFGASTSNPMTGIRANGDVAVTGDASLGINITGGNGFTAGIYANTGSITFDTTGDVSVDTSAAPGSGVNSYALYASGTSPRYTLTRAGMLTLKWAATGFETSYTGDWNASYNPANFAVYKDTANRVSTYRYGTPRTLTVAAGANGASGSKSREYLAGDTAEITANPANTGYAFKEWTTTDGVSFGNKDSMTTTVVMPASDVTVTATYEASIFTAQPVYTDNGDGTGSLAYQLDDD